MELPDPPEGWYLKYLSLNEKDKPVIGDPPRGTWSAHITSACDGAYVYGVGSSPRYAMLDALTKIENEDVFERFSGGQPAMKSVDLVKALGIGKPAMVRRV